jgi:hypothetical protein
MLKARPEQSESGLFSWQMSLDVAACHKPANGIIDIKTVDLSPWKILSNLAYPAFRTSYNFGKALKRTGFPFDRQSALFPYDTMSHFLSLRGEAWPLRTAGEPPRSRHSTLRHRIEKLIETPPMEGAFLDFLRPLEDLHNEREYTKDSGNYLKHRNPS